MDESNVLGDVRQVQRFFHRGVAAADYGDMLVAEEEPSQVAQADTPLPLNASSEGWPRYFAAAPVAMISASQV